MGVSSLAVSGQRSTLPSFPLSFPSFALLPSPSHAHALRRSIIPIN